MIQKIFEYHDVAQSMRLEKIANEKLDKLGEKYDMVIRADIFLRKKIPLRTKPVKFVILD